jgi:hypothetical protein
MSLREIAAADNRTIIEDTAGFGWPITVTDPDGLSVEMVGFSNDIAQVIDPQTGQAISGRLASVALSIATLEDEAFTKPIGVADGTSKPWVIVFNDINGHEHTFKVTEANPDRALGCVTCTLETYKLL